MMAAATSAGAVSPVTSYLAIEPGVRPSTDGFAPEASFGFGGLGLMGTGSGGGGCAVGFASGVPDWEGMLTELVRAAAAGCVPEGTEAEVQVRVECTYAEVVDVDIALPDDPVVETCVREAAWSVTLPDAFTQQDRFESTIDVS